MAASGAGPTDGAGEAIAIRPLAPADVSEARRVEDAAYGAASPRTPFERELRNGLADYLAAVPADAGGAILGLAGVWYTRGQLHLVTLAVDPARQGRGIGRALLRAVLGLAAAAELDSVALEVRASNRRALRLYERFGFRRAGRLRGFYGAGGEDAVVMLLDGLAAAPQDAPAGD